jgi:hypothetical protein
MLRMFRVHASAGDTDARRCERKGPKDPVVLHLLPAGEFTLRFKAGRVISYHIKLTKVRAFVWAE